jgi:hypothetical protein
VAQLAALKSLSLRGWQALTGLSKLLGQLASLQTLMHDDYHLLISHMSGYTVHTNGTLCILIVNEYGRKREIFVQNYWQSMLAFAAALRHKRLLRPTELLELVMQEMSRQ